MNYLVDLIDEGRGRFSSKHYAWIDYLQKEDFPGFAGFYDIIFDQVRGRRGNATVKVIINCMGAIITILIKEGN